jgi:dihydropteroate synthase
MGIVNVTPDSFSDGGAYASREAAVDHGTALLAAGADIVDVGGESTRPGAEPVDDAEERRRVVPVVAALADKGAVVSVDTSKPEVAVAVLDAGAEIVNDVNGLRTPGMTEACADAGVVIMHMQGTPRTMQENPRYDDVVADVRNELLNAAAAAEGKGMDRRRICVDPGIGFGKTFDHNLALLGNLEALVASGYPTLVGPSRKSFLGEILADAGKPTAPRGRDAASAAVVAIAIGAGATCVRVYDVSSALDAARTADAIVRISRKG